MARAAVAVLALVVGFALTGCFRKDYPLKAQVVSRIELEGAKIVDPEPLLEGLATSRSPRFLGIWDGVIFDYAVLDETVLEEDLVRVQRYYRARGYYDAEVSAARVVMLDEHRVGVQIRVNEGFPVRVARVQIAGIERLPSDVVAELQSQSMAKGAVFDEAKYEDSKTAILQELTDRGYAFAKVTAHAEVDVPKQAAAIMIEVDAGERARYGPITIIGLKQLPEDRVRPPLRLEEGAEYSRAAIEDARKALVNLGVFETVDIKQDWSKPESGVVPITVVVSEAPFRSVRVGGGVNLDVYELSANVTLGWEHRNFLGGMRRFSIDVRPGFVLYPTRIDNLELPSNVLVRNFFRTELRQPAFLEGRTTGFVAAEFNVYPVLYPGHDPQPDENLLGYGEVKGRAGVVRAFFNEHLFLTPTYNFQMNAPFAYRGEDSLETAYVSYPQILAIVDFRDDPLNTRSGFLLSSTFQVAGYIFGGSASDVRVQPEVRAYTPISKTVTLATRLTTGFLFPGNYGVTIQEGASYDPTDPVALRDQQLLLLRAFFSGGPISNRGYPYRGVGPQGILGFLLPNTGAACTDVNNPDCLRALGGFTLWEASVELRLPFIGALGTALFLDASDVSRETANIRLNYPHLSAGVGFRYGTPIGPVRLDVGYRVPYMQKVGEKTLPETEGIQPTIFGAPMAISFALGEAY
jgi:outer membrane protein insertion porin family/translocation and assembly module TamA